MSFISSTFNILANTTRATGECIWNNKGKIVACAAAVGVAVYYREEIAEFTNGMVTKITEVPAVEVPSVEV